VKVARLKEPGTRFSFIAVGVLYNATLFAVAGARVVVSAASSAPSCKRTGFMGSMRFS
jgi:hypothetical protein